MSSPIQFPLGVCGVVPPVSTGAQISAGGTWLFDPNNSGTFSYSQGFNLGPSGSLTALPRVSFDHFDPLAVGTIDHIFLPFTMAMQQISGSAGIVGNTFTVIVRGRTAASIIFTTTLTLSPTFNPFVQAGDIARWLITGTVDVYPAVTVNVRDNVTLDFRISSNFTSPVSVVGFVTGSQPALAGWANNFDARALRLEQAPGFVQFTPAG